MKLLSLEPFIPSGSDYERSKKFFVALGFQVRWDAGDYTGFERDGCKFILQNFDNKTFAENLMLSVQVDNIVEFRNLVIDNKLTELFGIRVGTVMQQPYGKEVNIIDLAGVCWHFVEA